MKTLNIGDTYNYMGYTLTVIRREGDIVIAENPDYGFEVFKVQHRKATPLPGGSLSEPGEYCPSSSQFGMYRAEHFPPKRGQKAHNVFAEYVKWYEPSQEQIIDNMAIQ